MGFAAESRGRSQPAIPMAGMIDILFLLLVFVVSTYSLRAQETQIAVDLSVSETGEVAPDHGAPMYITLTEDGRVFLGQREIEAAQLADELARLVDDFTTDQPVVIRINGEDRVQKLAWAMDQAYKVGLTDVSIATVGEE